jgi:osmotically-inducible protein OsmY
MRLIRRLLVLTLVAGAGVAGYAYWSDNGSKLREHATSRIVAHAAKREAAKIADKAVDTASEAKEHLGGTVAEAALTAKIKSKMALDDHVKARAINVDTSGSVATLSGVVASTDERKRAVQLAKDTEGISRVVDKLAVDKR